jgi:hypothetical protein
MLQQAMEAMVAPTFTAPADPQDPNNVVQVKKWQREYDAFSKKEAAWDAVKSRGFQLILQHCDKDVEQRIMSYADWEVSNTAQDPIGLLKLIRSALHKHDDVKQGTMAFVEQDIRLYTMWQKPDQTPLDFIKQVKAQADVINVHGGGLGSTQNSIKLIWPSGWPLITRQRHLVPVMHRRKWQQRVAVRSIWPVMQFELQIIHVSRT